MMTDIEKAIVELSLTDEELEAIQSCSSIKDLYYFFYDKKRISLVKKCIIKNIPINYHHRIQRTLLASMTDYTNYPLLILWTVVNLMTIGVVALSVITSGVLVVGLLGGILYGVGTYKDTTGAIEANEGYNQFYTFKHYCLNELKKRHDIPVNDARPIGEYLADVHHKSEIKNKYHIPSIRTGVATGLFVGYTMFTTYYIASHALVAAFGLTAAAGAMVGPIGLAVSLTIIAGISLYVGYKSYCIYRDMQVANTMQKKLEKKVNNEYAEYHHEKSKRLNSTHAAVSLALPATTEKSIMATNTVTPAIDIDADQVVPHQDMLIATPPTMHPPISLLPRRPFIGPGMRR